jgi:hypothetical protein
MNKSSMNKPETVYGMVVKFLFSNIIFLLTPTFYVKANTLLHLSVHVYIHFRRRDKNTLIDLKLNWMLTSIVTWVCVGITGFSNDLLFLPFTVE